MNLEQIDAMIAEAIAGLDRSIAEIDASMRKFTPDIAAAKTDKEKETWNRIFDRFLDVRNEFSRLKKSLIENTNPTTTPTP